MISSATATSGLMMRSIPSVLGLTIFLAAEGDLAAVTKYPEYSGFLTLPTVMDAPSSFARKQISMLVSSLFVTAIIKSARPTSASLSILGEVALPVIVLTSSWRRIPSITASEGSTIVTSCFPSASTEAMCIPTIPAPAIMIYTWLTVICCRYL